MHARSFGTTDTGKVRRINEDAFLDLPERGLWLVADGMGGHHAGDFASRLIRESLRGVDSLPRMNDFVQEVERRLQEVNRRLRQEAAQVQGRVIGSTVAVLISHSGHHVCLWAGDARIYRLRDGVVEQLTEDHTQVQEMVRRGLLGADAAKHHPSAHVVTRAVGAADELYLEMELFETRPGDRFLLCTDGLNREIADEELAGFLSNPDVGDSGKLLLETVLGRGARDNVALVVVELGGAA